MKGILKKIAPFISVVFFVLAIWFLEREMQQYNLQEVWQYVSSIPLLYIVESLVLCILSYLLLTGYDALGVQYIGEDLALPKTMRAGFIGYAFSHNIGMALITGGSMRYRIYSTWGLNALQVTKIMGFSAFTLWIGFCSMAGLSLLVYAPDLPPDLIPYISLDILGIILLVMVTAYLWACWYFEAPLKIWKWGFSFPDVLMGFKQVAIASVDWLLAASVLFVLLPSGEIPFFGFVGVFLLAQIVGLFSQVPGGLGVFESIMVLYLSNFMESSNILGILLVYRIIYYLLPLVVAMLLLGYQEYKANSEVVKEFGSKTAGLFPRLVPQLFSVGIFVAGAVLLFSGATPSEVPRMYWLQLLIPLPVIEMSHFLASVVGAMLLVLARGLQQRIDAAYHATIGVLIFGIIFSLLKGVSYVEAAILALMLLALIPARNEFHRKASLLSQPFSPVWVTMILMVIISSIWMGVFSYRNIEYQRELWWQFSLLGDAPRYLRASVAVLGGAIIFGLYRLFRPSHTPQVDDSRASLYKARQLANESPRIQSNLVHLDDKKILLSNDRQSGCVMYAVQDKSWVAMGDPMGKAAVAEQLIESFNELSTSHGGWPVFYQVHDRYLEYYRNIGLTILKLGEEAHINLSDFTLNHPARQELKAVRADMQRQQYTVDIIPKNAISSHWAELRAVSQAWLQIPGNHEKQFSLGYFNETYLKNFPIAVARNHEGTAMAFCNIWTAAAKAEMGYDLIRFMPSSPDNITNYLLTEVVLWAREQQYNAFNLGLAPLSLTDEKNLKPHWGKFTDQLYHYGEQFYNFQGLRHHKEKFNPEWEPQFLAAPSGLRLPTVLSHLATLISNVPRKA